MASTETEKRSLVLGIDLGTTSVKVTLLDPISKTNLLSKKADTNAHVDSDGNFSEQTVQTIFEVLKDTLSTIPKDFPSRVGKIGVCGQMHGCLFWKRNNKCLDCIDVLSCCSNCTSNLITWEDRRCCKDFLNSLPEASKNCLPLSTGFGCSTMFWLARNNPGFLKQYDCAGTVQDFLVAKLCGLDKPVMSIHNAASWGYCDVISGIWEKEILESSEFPVHLLPDVHCAGGVIGGLYQDYFGIPQGTKVGLAFGDLQCSVLANTHVKSDAVLNIGTSSQIAIVISGDKLSEFNKDNSPSIIQIWPYFNDEFVAVAASLTGGNVVSTFVDMLEGWMRELGLTSPSKAEIYNKIMQSASSKEFTSLDMRPTLWGERHNTELTGQVTQIKDGNISLSDVTMSLCQGIIRNLSSMMPRDKFISIGVERIIATGNAITQNPILQKETEKTWRLPVITRDLSDASLGAALAII